MTDVVDMTVRPAGLNYVGGEWRPAAEGMLVQLGVARGASVVATASKANSSRLLACGAKEVLDYHDEDWPRLVREITGGDGVTKAANAARGGAAEALQAVAAGGRLATITSDPPQ